MRLPTPPARAVALLLVHQATVHGGGHGDITARRTPLRFNRGPPQHDRSPDCRVLDVDVWCDEYGRAKPPPVATLFSGRWHELGTADRGGRPVNPGSRRRGRRAEPGRPAPVRPAFPW